MRVPLWLRNPKNLDALKTKVDRNFKSEADKIAVVDKLPEHYQKAFWEARTKEPAPVHYRPYEKTVEWDAEHGNINRLPVTTPIPPLFPAEADYGLWGGEGFVKGYKQAKKKGKHQHPRAPFWWIPELFQTVVYSEILNKYMLVTVTQRAKTQIDEAKGFDFYILKTHQVDLHSRLGMRLKREMLLALARKNLWPEDPEMQSRLLRKYSDFIIPEKEVEWVGLTLAEAERKYNRESYRPPVPLKEIFREQLLLELNRYKTETAEQPKEKSLLEKLNPFAKS